MQGSSRQWLSTAFQLLKYVQMSLEIIVFQIINVPQ